MEVELAEILSTLCQHPPFSDMEEEPLLEDMVQDMEIRYLRNDRVVLEPGQANNTYLYFIRSGAVEVFSRSGDLLRRMGEGELFGYASLLRSGKVTQKIQAIEDTLLYLIPAHWFKKLYEENDLFSDFFELTREVRLRTAMQSQATSNSDVSLMTCPVTSLLRREPVSIETQADIRMAAQKMAEFRVSSLLITEQEKLVGIVTDRDLRTRAIAAGLPYGAPISQIMTANPITLDSGDFAFEAVLKMMRQNVHHLPITRNGQPIGVLSAGDIVQQESHGSVYLISDILKQQHVAGLKEISAHVSHTFTQLVHADANTVMIGNAISRIGTAFVQRLLQLGEEKLGPPPIPYCFIAMGSQAREEQTIFSDQDNALILDDSFNPKLHDAYFKALAQWVCDGLDQCGYQYCPGDIMATNNHWRQPLATWKNYFTDWIEQPVPEALLRMSIFFDVRGIYGANEMADDLVRHIQTLASDNGRFLAAMARNANQRKPPLGFFRQFVLDGSGRQSRTFNLKERGIAPIIDMVRVHALACGSTKLNTMERLSDIEAAGLMPGGRARDLAVALELIGMTRIRHQKDQIEAGEAPNNHVDPDSLSEFERRNLRDAFHIVSRQQEFLKYRYSGKGGRHVERS